MCYEALDLVQRAEKEKKTKTRTARSPLKPHSQSFEGARFQDKTPDCRFGSFSDILVSLRYFVTVQRASNSRRGKLVHSPREKFSRKTSLFDETSQKRDRAMGALQKRGVHRQQATAKDSARAYKSHSTENKTVKIFPFYTLYSLPIKR